MARDFEQLSPTQYRDRVTGLLVATRPGQNPNTVADEAEAPPSAEQLAAEAVEVARMVALKADSARQALIAQLTTATPAQISTFVDNQVTDIAGARMLLKRILLVLATIVRS